MIRDRHLHLLLGDDDQRSGNYRAVCGFAASYVGYPRAHVLVLTYVGEKTTCPTCRTWFKP